MSEASVIFSSNEVDLTIECEMDDKIRDICQKYASKMETNLNSLLFLYEGKQLNFDLKFKDQANSLDKNISQMRVLVYKNDELICPKCDEKIKFDNKKIDELISSNENIKDTINGIKSNLDNIINNNSSNNIINNQLKNINTLLNAVNEDIQKNNETLINLLNDTIINNLAKYKNLNDKFKNKNIIKGVLDIKLNEIYDNFHLFYSKKEQDIDVYLNDKKIDMINEDGLWKIDYNFEKDGKYSFVIIFNNNIEYMLSFFEKCYNIIYLDLSNFDSSKVTIMKWMFLQCSKLKEIKGINKLITNQVINMAGMFQACKELEYLDLSNFITSNVNDMSGMFHECYKLKEIKGIHNFNTNKVTNMYVMFQHCRELKYLDLSNFDTSNVTNISFMFNKCNKLKEIKGIEKFNTSKVINMESLFQVCSGLQYIDVSNYDTSNVENMSGLFAGCYQLKEIKGINKLITNKVINMEGMFQCCYELEYIDLSNFDTSNIINMSGMFYECNKLKQINGIEKFITNKVTDMSEMFYKCFELEYLDLSNFDTSNVIDMQGMFFKCNKLKYLNLLNFSINCNTKDMLTFQEKDKCEFITNNNYLLNLFKSS